MPSTASGGTHHARGEQGPHKGQLPLERCTNPHTCLEAEGPCRAQHSPRSSLCCSLRTACSRALLLARSSRARGARPCCTAICRHGDRAHFTPMQWEQRGRGSGSSGAGAGAGPHRPCVACLLQSPAGCALGGLHSPQDAAVGAGGLDGPLNEPVLVDSPDDAVEGGPTASGQHTSPSSYC